MEKDKGRHRTRGGVKEQDLNQIEAHTYELEQEEAEGQGIVKDRDRDRDRDRNGNGNRDKDTTKDNARTLIEDYKQGKMEEHICFRRECY
jgi:hypothetical protein